MELYRIITEVIDTRSFSNLWYWIVLVVYWSMSSQRVVGVPFDLILRARRQGGQAEADMEAMVAINVRRFLGISRTAAVPMFAILSFVLTVLLTLAIFYRSQFAQAVLFLFCPMIFVSWLSLRTALLIEAVDKNGVALYRRLILHRRQVQMVGLLAIMITALFGMYQNMNISVLH